MGMLAARSKSRMADPEAIITGLSQRLHDLRPGTGGQAISLKNQSNDPQEAALPAYLIVHRREIYDSQGLKRYSDGIDEVIAKFGGKVAARSDSFRVLEGDWNPGEARVDAKPERLTILEFPTMAELQAWYDSDDYAELKAVRQTSSRSDIVAVETH
jgi:uncharacterized protein (DUF1330 family)